MTRMNISYEPHLALSELVLPPGQEWSPQFAGWITIQISSGNGYWLRQGANRELETGTVLVLAPQSQGQIRASQVNGLSLHFFQVYPRRLVELMTLDEQRVFDPISPRQEPLIKIVAPPNSIVERMKEACASSSRKGVATRLQLLQIFFEVFADKLKAEGHKPQPASDAKERLCDFLKQTPTSELLNISLAELVQITGCTPRHFSRVFRELFGMPFRDKQAELRLAQACKLLATTECKVVDGSLESGYQSLSLFNLMFTGRFG